VVEMVGVPSQSSPALGPAMHLSLPLPAVHLRSTPRTSAQQKNRAYARFLCRGGDGACQENPRHFCILKQRIISITYHSV